MPLRSALEPHRQLPLPRRTRLVVVCGRINRSQAYHQRRQAIRLWRSSSTPTRARRTTPWYFACTGLSTAAPWGPNCSRGDKIFACSLCLWHAHMRTRLFHGGPGRCSSLALNVDERTLDGELLGAQNIQTSSAASELRVGDLMSLKKPSRAFQYACGATRSRDGIRPRSR